MLGLAQLELRRCNISWVFPRWGGSSASVAPGQSGQFSLVPLKPPQLQETAGRSPLSYAAGELDLLSSVWHLASPYPTPSVLQAVCSNVARSSSTPCPSFQCLLPGSVAIWRKMGEAGTEDESCLKRRGDSGVCPVAWG